MNPHDRRLKTWGNNTPEYVAVPVDKDEDDDGVYHRESCSHVENALLAPREWVETELQRHPAGCCQARQQPPRRGFDAEEGTAESGTRYGTRTKVTS